MRKLGRAALAAALALSPLAAVAQTPAPAPALRALRVEGGIRLDGVLDEPEWQRADSIFDFRQRDPEEGAPASERTVLRVLAAPDGLYIGVWNYDRDPARIVRTQLRRDGSLDLDDYVAVLIDAERDQRSAVVFGVNANGAMFDGEVVSHQDISTDWNGVWDARARVGGEGWTAELFVPWQTLRYRRDAGAFGFNVVRFIRRKNEEVLWRAWLRQQGIVFQPLEGSLEVPGPLPGRQIFEGRPYVAGEGRLPARAVDSASGVYGVVDSSALALKVGFDGKLAVAPTVTLDITANTDFAQVDADRQVVNLTRFPVFFPEKRQFFLESSAIFALGQSARTELFNSRRIGLDAAGNVIPIVGGARLTGRLGHDRFGVLALRTGTGENAMDVVLRQQHDAFDRGYVGWMGTYQGGPGIADQRLAGGLDFAFPLLLKGQNFVPQGFLAATRNARGEPLSTAWRLFFDYPNDWSDDFLAFSRLEAGFDPALGFVRQAGVQRQTGALRFSPRPHRWGVRRLNFKVIEFDVNENLDGSLNNAAYEVRPLGADFEDGAGFELNLQHNDDVPADSFEIFTGVEVAAGRYGWNRIELQGHTSPGRPVTVELLGSVGGLYTGHATQLEYAVSGKLEPRLIVALDGNWERVRLANATFTAQVHRLRLDYATSPRFNTTLFVQWDNESDRLAVNARLHWIPSPGSDAYLVWNTAWPTALPGRRGIPFSQPMNGGLIGKLVYYFRR